MYRMTRQRMMIDPISIKPMAWTLLSCVLIFVALNIFTKYFLNKIRNLPPAPFPSLPIIGHLHLLNRPTHKALANISNRRGPLTLLQLGARQVLLVSSPSLAEECFTKNDIIFANRPRLLTGKHFGYNYTSVVWSSYGDHWRNLRKIVSLEILSPHRLQMLSTIRLEEVRSLVSNLFQEKSQTGVDMRKAFFGLTFNVITRMIAGKRYYGENVSDMEEAERFREIREATTRLNAEAKIGDYLPWLRSRGIQKRMVQLQKRRDGFLQSLVDGQRKRKENSTGSGERTKNLIQVLLSLQEAEPEYYTDDMIKSLIIALLEGATDTIIYTMEWAISLLLNHPQVLKKAQLEIDDQIGSERLVNESDVFQLPYLSCIINETFRMYPVTPLLAPHEASKDCMLGGFRVPKGTMLLTNVWAIQNDPKVWAEPTKFKPERFEGLDGNARDELRFRLMPFGYGRRICPGEGLATRIVGLAMASLIQCFELEAPVEGFVDMSLGTTKTFIAKAQPLEAICRPRPAIINILSQM